MLRINMNKTKRSAALLLSFSVAMQLTSLPLNAMDADGGDRSPVREAFNRARDWWRNNNPQNENPVVDADAVVNQPGAQEQPAAQAQNDIQDIADQLQGVDDNARNLIGQFAGVKPVDEENKGVLARTFATVKEHKYAVGGAALAAVAAGAAYWFRDQIKEALGLDDSDDDDEDVEQQDVIENDSNDSKDAGWSRNQKIAAGAAATGTIVAGVAAYKYRNEIRQGAGDATQWAQEKAGNATQWVKDNPKKTVAGGAAVAALGGLAYYLLSDENDDDDDEKTPEATERGRVADKSQKKIADDTQATFVAFSEEFVSSFKAKRMVKKLTDLHKQVVKTQNPMLYFEYEFANPLTVKQQFALHTLVQFYVHNIMSIAKLTAVQRAHYAFVASLAHTQYNAELFNAFREFAKNKNNAFYQLFTTKGRDQEVKRDAFLNKVAAAQTKK